MSELFVGITTWDDAPFVRRAVAALRRTAPDIDMRIVAWDNGSQRETLAALEDSGVPYYSQQYPQGDALNALLELSDAPYTLLMHSDVFMLHERWFPMLRACMDARELVLISPEDIGLGNMNRRALGTGMPERSFMLFDTAKIKTCRTVRWGRFLEYLVRGKKINSFRRLDFYSNHITHRLPALLSAHGFTWQMLQPLSSPREASPWFTL